MKFAINSCPRVLPPDMILPTLNSRSPDSVGDAPVGEFGAVPTLRGISTRSWSGRKLKSFAYMRDRRRHRPTMTRRTRRRSQSTPRGSESQVFRAPEFVEDWSG